MANEPDPFIALMARAAQGDQQAAQELYDRYHKPLITVIRYRLDNYPRLRALHDSNDFLQEVWGGIFADPDKLRDFSTFESFLKYLAEAACHKIDKAQRRYGTKKRDRRRVRHLSDAGVATVAASVADPRPRPDQQAVVDDLWQQWLLSLPRRQRQVVLMLRDGFSYPEIAAELDCSVRSIERRVARLRFIPPPRPLPYL